MAATEPRRPSVDPLLLRDYRHGRLSAEAEHAFEQRLLTEPNLAEDLAWDEHLEQVAGTWALEGIERESDSHAADAIAQRLPWKAGVALLIGAVLAGGVALMWVASGRHADPGSAQVVRFETTSPSAPTARSRSVDVVSDVQFLVIEVPSTAPEGASVAIRIDAGRATAMTFVAQVRDGFASTVVPTQRLPQGRYEVRVAPDASFELLVMRHDQAIDVAQ